MSGRKEHAETCKAANQSVMSNKYLLKYQRDKHGRPTGVVIAFKDLNNKVRLGWSKCNVKLEQFDKHIGINKAIGASIPVFPAEPNLNHYLKEVVPNSLSKLVSEMKERAVKYFKV